MRSHRLICACRIIGTSSGDENRHLGNGGIVRCKFIVIRQRFLDRPCKEQPPIGSQHEESNGRSTYKFSILLQEVMRKHGGINLSAFSLPSAWTPFTDRITIRITSPHPLRFGMKVTSFHLNYFKEALVPSQGSRSSSLSSGWPHPL